MRFSPASGGNCSNSCLFPWAYALRDGDRSPEIRGLVVRRCRAWPRHLVSAQVNFHIPNAGSFSCAGKNLPVGPNGPNCQSLPVSGGRTGCTNSFTPTKNVAIIVPMGRQPTNLRFNVHVIGK